MQGRRWRQDWLYHSISSSIKAGKCFIGKYKLVNFSDPFERVRYPIHS